MIAPTSPRRRFAQLVPPSLNDPAQYACRPDIPILVECPEEGIDVAKLELLARNANRNAAHGNYAQLLVGHTRDDVPETTQPPRCGWARNYDVGTFAGKPALLADFYIDRRWAAKAGEYPHRSAELWKGPLPDHWQIDHVSLLKTSPRFHMGLVTRYGRSDTGPQRLVRFGRGDTAGLELVRFGMPCRGLEPGRRRLHEETTMTNSHGPTLTRLNRAAETRGDADRIATLLRMRQQGYEFDVESLFTGTIDASDLGFRMYLSRFAEALSEQGLGPDRHGLQAGPRGVSHAAAQAGAHRRSHARATAGFGRSLSRYQRDRDDEVAEPPDRPEPEIPPPVVGASNMGPSPMAEQAGRHLRAREAAGREFERGIQRRRFASNEQIERTLQGNKKRKARAEKDALRSLRQVDRETRP